VRYVLYVLYIAYTAYSLYTAYNVMWLAYHSLLHGSTGSILDRAYINQLASCDSSPSSRNIVLKASVTSPMEAPAVGFRNTTPPPIEAELRQCCGYYIYIKGIFKV